MLGVVSIQEPVRVVLEIQRTTRTIHGQIAVDGAAPSGFFGWLELIDELERAASCGERSNDERSAHGGGEQ